MYIFIGITVVNSNCHVYWEYIGLELAGTELKLAIFHVQFFFFFAMSLRVLFTLQNSLKCSLQHKTRISRTSSLANKTFNKPHNDTFHY